MEGLAALTERSLRADRRWDKGRVLAAIHAPRVSGNGERLFLGMSSLVCLCRPTQGRRPRADATESATGRGEVWGRGPPGPAPALWGGRGALLFCSQGVAAPPPGPAPRGRVGGGGRGPPHVPWGGVRWRPPLTPPNYPLATRTPPLVMVQLRLRTPTLAGGPPTGTPRPARSPLFCGRGKR